MQVSLKWRSIILTSKRTHIKVELNYKRTSFLHFKEFFTINILAETEFLIFIVSQLNSASHNFLFALKTLKLQLLIA